MRFSHEIGGYGIDRLVAQARDAERLHYDMLWVPDHIVDIQPPYGIYDTWTLISFLATRTNKLNFGSGVTDVQRIHPAKLASILCTLDHLTNGRVILGIGAGEIMNTAPYGIPWEDREIRIEKLREYVTMVKRLWASSYEKPATWTGRYYSLNEAHLALPPMRKKGIPIYVGAMSSSKLLETVGEMANGWFPGSMNTLDLFKEKVGKIKRVASKSHRRMNSIDIIASIPTIVCPKTSVERVRKQIKQGLKREMIFNQYLFKALGIKREETGIPNIKNLNYQIAAPSARIDRELSKAIASMSVSEEILDKGIDSMMAIGTPESCAQAIEPFIRAGATHIFFASMMESSGNYRLIGEKVIPLLTQGFP